jgi:hypothetical protein
MGMSPAEFWNAAHTAATTGGGVAAWVVDSDQTSIIEHRESDIMSRHCSTLRHFGTPSGLKKTAAVCEKRAILLALWLF